MPEDYGQGYGNGYPQQQMPQQPMPEMPQQMPQGQQPYGYEPITPQMPQQMPMGGMQYGYGYGYGYPGQPQKKGMGTGAVIGITLGALALIGLLVFFIFGRPTSNDPSYGDDTPVATRGDDDTDESDDRETKTDPDDGKGQGGTSGDGTTTQTQISSGATSGVTVDINNLSDDWIRGEVNLNGVGYRLYESTYGDLVANGWVMDDMDAEKVRNNNGSLVLNSGDMTIFSFEHPSFPNKSLIVGLGNFSSGPINYDQSIITYLDVSDLSIIDSGSMYDFVISKGAKIGMTDSEIVSLFGMPDENGSVYESDDKTYKSLEYTVIGDGDAFSREYYTLEFHFYKEDDGQYRVIEIMTGIL